MKKVEIIYSDGVFTIITKNEIITISEYGYGLTSEVIMVLERELGIEVQDNEQ